MVDFYRLEYPDPDDYFMSAAGGIAELPTDYAWMNNDPSGGTRASYSGAQSGGHAEDGTMFIANENDALSATGNRTHQAIAIGMDLLDNQLRRPIAVPTHLDDSTGGTPVSAKTIAITEMVWLGLAGTEYTSLFQIVDADGNEIIDSSGVTCIVSAANPPPGDAGLLNGFAAVAVQLTIAPAIPVNTTYRIYYAKKGSLAEMPRDALTRLAIPARALLDGGVRKQLNALHSYVGQTWDSAWWSDMLTAGSGGLYERYNRTRIVADFGTLPYPEPELVPYLTPGFGNGSWILRDGPAPTVYGAAAYQPFVDPLGASWKAVMREEYTASLTTVNASGFVYLGGEYVAGESGGTSYDYATTAASFLHLGAVRMADAAATYSNAYTYLPYDGACSIGYDGVNSELYMEVSSPFQFTDGATYTDIVTGLDVIDLHDPTAGVSYPGGRRYSFLIHRIIGQTRIWLRRLDGSKPGNLGTYAGTMRWHPFRAGMSDGAAEFHNYNSDESSRMYGMTIIGPRQHGTMPGPGAGSFSQSFGLNVYAGTNTASSRRVFQSGYVPRDVTIEESAPLVTAYLMATGAWTMTSLTLTTGNISGSVNFVDDVEFSDTALFGGEVQFDDVVHFGAGFDGGGSSVDVFDGLDIATDKHVTLLGDGSFYAGTSGKVYTDKLAVVDAAFITVEDDVWITTADAFLKVDRLQAVTRTYLDVTTPIKAKNVRYYEGEVDDVTLASADATPTWGSPDAGAYVVNVTAVPTSGGRTTRTITVTFDAEDMADYGVYYVSVKFAVAVHDGSEGVADLNVNFVDSSATAVLAHAGTDSAVADFQFESAGILLNRRPNAVFRVTKVPHTFEGSAHTSTVYFEPVGHHYMEFPL